MANLFGRNWTREELLARVGDMDQLAGVKRHILDDGPGRGVEAVDVWTGSGLAFTVVPGRGMDIAAADYAGRSLCWRSGAGVVAPGLHEHALDLRWLKTFFGGLLTTCGLRSFGSPCEDEGEQLGIHGEVSNIPARGVSAVTRWDGDEYILEVTGTVREVSVLQYDVVLTRTIRTRLGAKSFTIHDVVENVDQNPTPHMILYHINLGFPVVDDGSEMRVKADEWKPRDDEAADGQDDRLRFHAPVRGYNEKVYMYKPTAEADGRWTAGVVNRELQKGHPLGVYVRCKHDTLPNLTEWKMMGEHTYVVGVEPCSTPLVPRDELRRLGQLPVLEPGQKREYEVEIGVISTGAELEAFEAATG